VVVQRGVVVGEIKASGVKMSSRPSSSLVNTGEDSFDFLFKIVLIGDCGVGKTCVVQRFKSGTFIERHGNTIGVDFSMKTVIVDGKKVKVSFERAVLYFQYDFCMNADAKVVLIAHFAAKVSNLVNCCRFLLPCL